MLYLVTSQASYLVFLSDRKQRVLLNGQTSEWQNVTAGVPQGSILGPLLFLIYINDLFGYLSSKAKLFADDTSLFSVTHVITTSANELNNYLKKISDWAFQWKMSFNPVPSKQAQEVIFSRKLKNVSHPPLVFNIVNVSSCKSPKYLGILLDARLTFEEHYKTILSNTNRTIGLLGKLQSLLPRATLKTIYKAFVRPHLDYGDVLYDQAFNASFHEKLESIQYSAGLALTGAIRGTSKEKIYQELGLESPQIHRWYRKLCLFYMIYKNQSPYYLYNIIPTINKYNTFRNSGKIPYFKTKHNFFKNSFFPSVIVEWNKLESSLRRCDTYNVFKSNILKFIRLSSNSFFDRHNPIGIKYITRIRLGLSHLQERKFKHGFQDTLNLVCNCSNDAESAIHFFLHCPLYSNERRTLLNSLVNIDQSLLDNTDVSLTQILLFGNSTFNVIVNTKIVNLTINFVL